MVIPEGQHLLDFGKDLPKDKPGAVLDRLTNDQKALLLGAGLSARIMLAERSFKKFLEFVSVSEPPPGRGLIAFEFWPHLGESATSWRKTGCLFGSRPGRPALRGYLLLTLYGWPCTTRRRWYCSCPRVRTKPSSYSPRPGSCTSTYLAT